MHRHTFVFLLSSLPTLIAAAPPTTNPSSSLAIPTSQTNQPPISIELANATLTDVTAALSKATNTHIVATHDDSADRYTLRVRGGQFWDIFERLDRQFPITLTPSLPQDHAELALRQRNGPASSQVRIGDFMIYAREVSRTRKESPLLLHWAIIADPRINIAKVELTSLDVVDEHGTRTSMGGKTDAVHWSRSRHLSLQTKLMEPATPLGTNLWMKATMQLDVGQPVGVKVELHDIRVKSSPARGL